MVKQWVSSEETETKIILEDMSGVLMPFLFLDESHGAEGKHGDWISLILGEK